MNKEKKLSESDAQNYFRQLADAIAYLQEKNIVHRDLKPANLMITNKGALKVVDFGLSKIYEEDNLT